LEKFWNISTEDDGCLVTSLAWQRYVPTTTHVHNHGCRLALRRNEEKRLRGRFKQNNRCVYCGAYELKAHMVRALPTATNLEEVSAANVIHKPEHRELAHTELRILLKPGVTFIGASKTAILDRLWYGCSGPLKHQCKEDIGMEKHPSSMLPPAPMGSYVETRSSLCRLWCIIRSHVYSWRWKFFPDRPSRRVLA
jgi:hypothetical protein